MVGRYHPWDWTCEITTTATEQRSPDGTWTLAGIDCTVKSAAPQVTAVLVLREVRRLVRIRRWVSPRRAM